jgi:hypothetical protein
MIRNKIVHLTLLISIASCQSPKEKVTIQNVDNVYRVDIESSIEHKSELKISDISSEIVYIPLETTEDNLIRKILKVYCSEKNIYVGDANGLYQFTDSGKFIRQIGSLGRGPGEHSSLMDFTVNEKGNTVIIQGEFSIVAYDLEGNYVENLNKLPGSKFIFFNPDKIAFYKPNDIESPVNLVITSLDLKPIREFYNKTPKPRTKTTFRYAPLYVFNDHVFFKENFNDTLFCLRDSILIPYIIFNEKDLLLDHSFELPNGDLSDLIRHLDLVEDKLLTHSILESERHVFISYIQGQNPRTQRNVRFIFNKEDNSTYCISNGEFINDIDGGMGFFPQLITDTQNLVKWIDVNVFKAHTASNAFLNSSPKYPLKKKGLEELSSSLKENDNPVLMVVKLK